MKNQVILGDCLEVMKDIPDKSIDMILCDLPYGTTACKWDTIIPFEPLWEQYKRIIKDNGAIVLTASQPFTSALVMSNPKWFKYEWIWGKTVGTNFLNAKFQPIKKHENILCFYNPPIKTFNPQMLIGKPYKDIRKKVERFESSCTRAMNKTPIINKGERYPNSIIIFENGNNKSLHPTQKPVALFEYLIKTYTTEGDLVLDNCAGSGTTGVACKNLNRNFILIEKEKEYVDIIQKRIDYVVKV
jgi:site-specific DNA-methyltransferase (adenine-specific)